MEKLVQKRSNYRRQVTRHMKKLEAQFADEPYDLGEIELAYTRLMADLKQLTTADENIEDARPADKEETEEDVEIREKYQDDAIRWIIKVKKILEGNSAKLKEETAIQQTIPVKSTKISAKLPQLKIPPFGGELHEWKGFWEQFKAAIDTNQDLESVQKFIYLRAALTNDALAMVAGLQLTEVNYDVAKQVLVSYYDDDQAIIQSHLQMLAAMTNTSKNPSPKELREIFTQCRRHVWSLNALGVQSDTYGRVLIPVILRLFPEDIDRRWIRQTEKADQVNLDKLLEFLNEEVTVIEKTFCRRNTLETQTSSDEEVTTISSLAVKQHQRQPAVKPKFMPFCAFCESREHWTQNCKIVTRVADRRTKLKEADRCLICFKRGHYSSDCQGKERFGCRRCPTRSHHYSICPSTMGEGSQNVSTMALSLRAQDIFLQTAKVWIHGQNGTKCLTRCLLDGASHRTYITVNLANELNLRKVGEECLHVCGFESEELTPTKRRRFEVKLSSYIDNTPIKLEALETSNTFDHLPPVPVEITRKFKDLKFADAREDSQQPPIGILIGTDFYHMVVMDELLRIGENMKLTKSIFGWILHGSRPGAIVAKTTLCNNITTKTAIDDNSIRQFWDLEMLGIREEENKKYSIQEDKVHEQFKQQFEVKDNRVTVCLPWKDNADELQNNKRMAERRFASLQKKFDRDPEYKLRYTEAVNEYFKNGHVEVSNDEECNGSYYIPHHAIIDDTRETTKTRIVFDAASHEPNVSSLNDVMEPGPNLNPDSTAILLRFRTYKKVIAADGSKAFLQIGLKEGDRKATRFYWFETIMEDGKITTNPTIKVYQFVRLPFGLNCSPFLLAATIRHYAELRHEEFPGLWDAIEKGLYVDDFTNGDDKSEQIRKRYYQTSSMMSEISIPMVKWITNDKALQDEWIEKEESTRKQAKILGIGWDKDRDEFSLNVDRMEEIVQSEICTKRTILQITAKIYDPLGFLTPLTVTGKLLFQDTWSRGLDWNSILPEDLAKNWKLWLNELPRMNEIKLKRWMGTLRSEPQGRDLHIFCDASERAYGTAIYIRTITDEKVECNLLMSKSRLAPTRKVTLPRLELLAAVIGTRLSAYVKSELDIEIDNTWFWTDSMVTLCWICNRPEKWKPFVCNRVTEIQKQSTPQQWHYCPGTINPADHLTRGLTVEKLKESDNWWHGPSWLTGPEVNWPSSPTEELLETKNLAENERRKNVQVFVMSMKEEIIEVERINDFKKLTRIMAWTYRFINNCGKKEIKKRGELDAEEIQKATQTLIKKVQQDAFKFEIEAIQNKLGLSKDSKIRCYNPFLDKDGILRLGGRLQQAEITYNERHPVIIDGKNHVTGLLIYQEHARLHHMGTRITLAELRQKYWIVNGRQVVKSVIHKCVICKRLRKNPGREIEAPMPVDRLKLTTPFDVTGVDFAGPLYVKGMDIKHYIALFTCATTRAIHLELVSSMSAETFILALRRFFARRGIPTVIYSDNAKTFKRTDKELSKIWQEGAQILPTYLAHQGVTWKYIVERAAWWGGWWERMVQTVKHCLKKTIGRANVSKEELETILMEIEATINCRPITFDYTDEREGEALTPSYFLIGRRLTELPEPRLNTNEEGELSRCWKRKQQLLQSFGSRWRKEYLLDLQSYHRVKQPTIKGPIFEIDDVVLLSEEKIPQQRWTLARIIEVKRGRDGKIRSCVVRDKRGRVFRRPIQLLHPLELNLLVKGGEDVVNLEPEPVNLG